MRKWIGVGVISAAAVVGSGIWVHAQRVLPSPRVAPPLSQDAPTVLTGSDFGFRVDSWSQDGTPVGKIVIRHDGKWVEIRIPVEPRRVTVK